MTSPIDAIGAVGGITPLTPVTPSLPTAATDGPNTDFASMLSAGLQNVQNLQNRAGDLAVQVADGTLTDPAQYTIASTEAALAVQLTMAVRNKAVEAFQEIMRMQA
ncbi:MAG TPA: flagellar hook-basal body complex protein FliE [Actinoplanes sp.]|nr:flagellar hook-basal body complex protein FliE [Actinoplanes sp.]